MFTVCQDADMEQVGDLDQPLGYVLKQAATALRSAMDTALRPLELTVPQYACLELLGHRPGLSAAELARGAFVTRQSMHAVLLGLEDRSLLTRAAPHGRALPTELTPAGRSLLASARMVVADVEARMVRSLSAESQQRLRADLDACTAALTDQRPRT
jgi:DNA-binding MarR family transcriptional regulator